MTTLHGKGVYGGIASGKIRFYQKAVIKVRREHISDPEAEIKRFHEAKKVAITQLQHLFDQAMQKVGQAEAQIFEVHSMMLEDGDFNESIENMIELQQLNAEYSVAMTADNFANMFEQMDDEYMKQRGADVKDISDRLLKILEGNTDTSHDADEKVVICAHDLSPSETVSLDKGKVLAFITEVGSANSHTAILARTMNIPAIIGVGTDLMNLSDGTEVIVDGFEGAIYVEPDQMTKDRLLKRKQQEEDRKKLLQRLKGKETVTKSGRKIHLYANIGALSDVGAALLNDAAGIGLFRSEFIYLESKDYPGEDQQFHIYKQVLENMAGKKVIIRTLDIGADKKIDYFNLDKEENPALGFRAIRICLERPELFKTQLRALLRASAYGNLSIMFPMITSLWEVQEIKRIMEEVKTELKNNGISFAKVEIGIMIETPAAVMISDELAQEVDFFSIGTNDLTQYTLAIDRQNPILDRFYDSHHPAVLNMIKQVTEHAHKHNTWVGICGELAADIDLTETFVRMGIDELSVAPSMILPVREAVMKCE